MNTRPLDPEIDMLTESETAALSQPPAAVGEAVAWLLVRKSDGYVLGSNIIEPIADQYRMAERDGHEYRPLYTHPPATGLSADLADDIERAMHKLEAVGKNQNVIEARHFLQSALRRHTSGPAANPQGVDDAMVERAEDYYYDNSPFNGPDELREGIRQMLIAALAHKGNGE